MAQQKSPAPAGQPSPAAAGNAVAVVELFTSEGCSSCPPADDALAAAAKAYPGRVYVLGYHVDYWDRLGWKDPFSNAAWTSRQSRYAELFNLNSIYTPQAIVNGGVQFTGSERSRLFTTIDQALKRTPATAPELTAVSPDNKTIRVSYKTPAGAGRLNIALVQHNADTQVQRGENEGKHLHHINIVRDLKTVAAAPGAVSFQVPAGLSATAFSIIAFVQDPRTLAISSATEVRLQ